MEYEKVLKELEKNANPENVAGMARFGINPKNTLGVCTPKLFSISKKLGKNRQLAVRLWNSGIHEARILAAMVAEPGKTDEATMEKWVRDFDSWDVCDQVCFRLFDKTPFAYKKAFEWSKREGEFVKRSGFALMASLAIHDKKAPDVKFEKFYSAIKRESGDGRNFVRKAVNWALRNIGKRSKSLNKSAIRTAREIEKMESKSARWIAKDALRELRSEAVQKRLKR